MNFSRGDEIIAFSALNDDLESVGIACWIEAGEIQSWQSEFNVFVGLVVCGLDVGEAQLIGCADGDVVVRRWELFAIDVDGELCGEVVEFICIERFDTF